MRLTLQSELSVRCIAVFAEMAWMERRPELGQLCRAACDSGLLDRDAIEAVLPGIPDQGVDHLLNACLEWGLCDDQFHLTHLGERLAETDEAPIPEQGLYKMWIIDDPAVGCQILAVERLSSSWDLRFEDPHPLKNPPPCHQVFTSVIDDRKFMVRGFPANHDELECLEMPTEAHCQLLRVYDFEQERQQTLLTGQIEAPLGRGLCPIQQAPEERSMPLFHWVEHWDFGTQGEWDPKHHWLAVPLSTLSDREKDHFEKTITLDLIEIPEQGIFENVTLESVPLGPQSAAAAQVWAMDCFDRALAKNGSPLSYSAICALFDRFTVGTPLEPFHPKMPSKEELLQKAQAEGDLSQYWGWAAAFDLALDQEPEINLDAYFEEDEALEEQIPLEEDPMQPGRHYLSPNLPDHLTLFCNTRLAMQQLVDFLVLGHKPRRVLLCDRYVRENFAQLKLFVAALRNISSDLEIHIWTLKPNEDYAGETLLAIQEITGIPAQNYPKLFGPKKMHSRYFFVDCGEGQGFCWAMTHSPLHGRIRDACPYPGPTTPLLWDDMQAYLLCEDEIEPRLQQWFKEGQR